jgi:hypothetical protein
MIKKLLRNINIINLVLGLAILMLSLRLSASFEVEALRLPPMPEAGPENVAPEAQNEPPLAPAGYAAFTGQSMFWSERMSPQKVKDKPPPPKPEVVLYGTLIAGDKAFAFIDNTKSPRNTPGRGKRLRVLVVGDSVGGFSLEDILEDRIVLKRDSEVMTVHVTYPSKRKKKYVSRIRR